MIAIPRRIVSLRRSATTALRRIGLATLAAIAAALAVASTQPAVDAQPLVYRRVDLTLIDTLGGAVTGVVVDGATGIAYVSRGARVEALDVTSDPTTPKVLATSERLAGVARVLGAAGGRVFVAVRTTSGDGITVEALSTLRAFDARDLTPLLPTSGSSIAVSASVQAHTGDDARVERAFAADATAAYLVGTDAVRQVRVVDLRAWPPGNEATVLLSADVNGLAVVGATLLAATDDGLTAIDVSDPSKPVVRGDLALLGGAGALAIKGTTAYATTYAGLAAVDIGNPSQLALRGPRNPHCGNQRDGAVAITGGRAWVVQGNVPFATMVRSCGLAQTDGVGSGTLIAFAVRGIAAAGDAVLVATQRFGIVSLTQLDPPDHSFPFFWHMPALGAVGGLTATGDVVRATDSDSELWTFDATSAAAPVPLGRSDYWPPTAYRQDDLAAGLAVRGDVAFQAFIGGHAYGGSVAAIALPPLAPPSVLGQWRSGDVPWNHRSGQEGDDDRPTSAYGPYLSGDTLFVTGESVALTALDVSNPAAPRWLGRFTGPEWEYMGGGVHLDGTRAWLAMYAHGLGLLDVSDPTMPRLIDRIALPDSTRDVARIGSYVLASTVDRVEAVPGDDFPPPPTPGRGLLVVLDAATHRPLARLPTDVPGDRLVVDGTRVLLYGEGRIEAVDMRDPLRPVAVGAVWTGAADGTDATDGPEVRPLAVVGDTIWAGTGDLGVSIYRLTEGEPFTPPPPISARAFLPYGAVPRP